MKQPWFRPLRNSYRVLGPVGWRGWTFTLGCLAAIAGAAYYIDDLQILFAVTFTIGGIFWTVQRFTSDPHGNGTVL